MTAPRIRAGDADRQQSVDRLARHFTEGRLDTYEYDDRVQKAYATVYLDELPTLFTDLPSEPISPDRYQVGTSPVDAYEKAWRQGYGPVDRPMFSGLGHTRRPVQRGPHILALVFVALIVVFLLTVTHGLIFPFPLIWIGWFGLTAARRGHRRTGPGPRR